MRDVAKDYMRVARSSDSCGGNVLGASAAAAAMCAGSVRHPGRGAAGVSAPKM